MHSDPKLLRVYLTNQAEVILSSLGVLIVIKQSSNWPFSKTRRARIQPDHDGSKAPSSPSWSYDSHVYVVVDQQSAAERNHCKPLTGDVYDLASLVSFPEISFNYGLFLRGTF